MCTNVHTNPRTRLLACLYNLEKFKPRIDHGGAQQRPDECTNTREVFQLPPLAPACWERLMSLSAFGHYAATRNEGLGFRV